MKIAVTYENGEIFQHFGHTEVFKVYTVENQQIVDSQEVSTMGNGHGALAGVLLDLGVEVLICGGIGGGARAALAQCGIDLYPGAQGKADDAVAAFLQNQLQYDPNTMCSHHGSDHNCGDHKEGCGHNCGH